MPKSINVKLPDEVYSSLETLAKAKGLRVATFVRVILHQFAASAETKQPTISREQEDQAHWDSLSPAEQEAAMKE